MTTLAVRIPTPQVFEPLLAPARYKGAWGGRGSAKSHFFADSAIDVCLQMANEGCRFVCVREVQRSLQQSVKKLLEDKIERHGLRDYFGIQRTEITTPGGGVIIFVGMNDHTSDTIKSLEAFDYAWVEEAQSLSERSLKLLRPTIRKERSEIWFSWNPRQATDPVDAFLRTDDPPPRSVVVRANFTDNPFFPDVLREEMEYDRRRDHENYEHVWEGAYERSSEARIYKNWREEAFETPPDVSFLFGSDWGFAVDPTVLVRGFLKGRTLFIDHESYKVGCEIDHSPFLFDVVGCEATACVVRGWLDLGKSARSVEPPKCDAPGHGMSRRWVIVGDSARPESISYMRRHGYPRMEASIKGANSVDEGIKFLQSYDIVVHPRCVHTIDELKGYKWKTDPLTGEILPIPRDKKNHVMDALRYAAEKTRRAAAGGALIF